MNNKVLAFIGSVLLSFTLASTCVAKTSTPLSQRSDVTEFINMMVVQYKFNKAELTKTFNQVKLRPKVIHHIKHPYEKKTWNDYQKLFVSDKRAQKGVEFWQKHSASLRKAQKIFGVPASVIVAIIGVESNYGKQRGKFRVIDSLSTLGFEYSPRAKFFKKELREFLLLTREEDVNPLEPLGSYAGAMGLPQFMPSSYRHYAVDFTGNGQKDLMNNIDDVIGSVANYFSEHGWQNGQPIAEPAKVHGKKYKTIVNKGHKPKFTITQLNNYGIKPIGKHPQQERVAVFELNPKTKPEYWLGFNNFYVITRYNTSKLYAMAVFELSQKIVKLHNTQKRAA